MGSEPGDMRRRAATWARRVLRPIVSMLVRSGLTAGEFSAIGTSLFVDVASREFGIRGRRANSSRIAMLTGLSRAQVKRELDSLDAGGGAFPCRQNDLRHASRVLQGWHTDQRFMDACGAPRPLAPDQADGFPALYAAFSGKAVPMSSILKELLRVGAVTRTGDGSLAVQARCYVPASVDWMTMRHGGAAIEGLAATVKHNLQADAERRPRFLHTVTSDCLDRRHVGAFEDFLQQEAQAFLQRTRDWLREHALQTGERDTADAARVGVGVYEVQGLPSRDPD